LASPRFSAKKEKRPFGREGKKRRKRRALQIRVYSILQIFQRVSFSSKNKKKGSFPPFIHQ
jgi:hypothetical protein